jgi:hypothetical protein
VKPLKKLWFENTKEGFSIRMKSSSSKALEDIPEFWNGVGNGCLHQDFRVLSGLEFFANWVQIGNKKTSFLLEKLQYNLDQLILCVRLKKRDAVTLKYR